MLVSLPAGVVALPTGAAFPGVATSAKGGKAGTRPVCFATAGERGRIRIWRSDTGGVHARAMHAFRTFRAANGMAELLESSTVARKSVQHGMHIVHHTV